MIRPGLGGLPRALAVLLSGGMFVAAFPPLDLGALAWVALVPLFLAADGVSPRAAFWLGYAWGIVALGGELWWITTFGPPVWLLGALVLAVFPALTLAAAAWIGRGQGPFGALRLAVLWTAVEILRGVGPLGFPWALLGESQHRAAVVSQSASAVGVYGVSLLVVLVNATLAALLARAAGRAVPTAITGAAVAASVLWGTAVLHEPAIPSAEAVLEAAVIQPDYAPRLTWDAGRAARDLDALGRLTHEAASRGARLVVWPETASPVDIARDPAMLATIRSWVRRDHVALIASSLEGAETNSAFSFSPDGVLTGRYDKRRLVPFAEFGERAGRSPGVLPTPLAGVGVVICFESVFPELSRRSAAAGADLLVIMTNDAWFDGRVAPAQHAAIAPFRAIEEGRYLLRAANSGPSMILDPHGRVIARLPQGARGVLTARVAPRQDLTPYARYGHFVEPAVVLAGGVALAPRVLAFMTAQAGVSAFRQLVTVSLLPLVALLVPALGGFRHDGTAESVIPLPMLAALVPTALLGLLRRERRTLTGFIPALLAALAVVVGLAAMAFFGFSRHGTSPVVPPPPGGWVLGSAVQIFVVGLTLEWWLRGLVFTAAVAWKGWGVAVVWSAVLGMVAAVPRGAEAMIWGLAGGVAFGLIRARWPQVPALAIAHGAGNVLLGFTVPPW